MTNTDWADQYRSDREKQAAARAATLESLLLAADYEACHEWLNEWESEDKAPGSLFQRYQQILSELRSQRKRLTTSR